MILLIEDSDTVGQHIARQLSRIQGQKAVHVTLLGDALARLRTEVYDLIVLDLNLPDSKSAETVTHIPTLTAYAPVVVCSGMGMLDQGIRDRCVSNGAAAFVDKAEILSSPFVLRNVAERIIRTTYGD